MLLLATVFVSCSDEFSPNAEWKEVPVVYCVLDQDDTVSYVRLQKCYLGDGNMKSYAGIFDSVNYQQGAVSVEIVVWRDSSHLVSGEEPVRRMAFDYRMMTDKESGPFAYPNQPVYRHKNEAGELVPGYMYQLQVRHADTKQLIATATTTLVGDCSSARWLASLNSIASGGTFNFRRNKSCLVAWHPLPQARRYQLSVSFLYRRARGGDVVSLPIPFGSVVSSLDETELSSSVSQYPYFLNIQQALASDTSAKYFVDSVAVALMACNEDFHAYLNSVSAAANSTVQEQQFYSNIQGGVGVFGSRRAHLVDTVAADKSDAAPNGMHYMLEQLNIGF